MNITAASLPLRAESRCQSRGCGSGALATERPSCFSVTSELLPAGTLIVGAGLTFAAQVYRERFTSSRERETRNAEREVARDAFQRETLLELQDAVLAVLRSTADIHSYQRRVYAETQRYADSPEPKELLTPNQEANAQASRLLQRVIDDDLRQAIRTLQKRCAEILMHRHLRPEGSDRDMARQAEADFTSMAIESAELENRLGLVLRNLL
jgi:hypothetical protein